MREHHPPVIAAWMLEHLLPGHAKEALSGDLREQFANGRPARWFWRQTLTAVALGFARNLRGYCGALAFAMLWTVPAPAWSLYLDRFIRHNNLMGRIWMLDWPYSSICGTLVPLGLLLAFTWVGLFVYWLLASLSSHHFKRWNLIQSLVAGMLTFLIAVIANALLLHGHRIDVQNITYLGSIKDPRQMMQRLPFFLSLLVSIWVAFPARKQRVVKTVM